MKKSAFQVEDENIRITVESDLRLASRILSGSSIDELRLWPEDSVRKLTLYCYLSQVLSLGTRGIAVTGSLGFDSALGRVRAQMVVASTNPHESENMDGKNTNQEWEFKDLEANGDLKVTDITDRDRYPRKPVNIQTHIQDFLAVCKFAKAGKVCAADVNTWIIGRCWTPIHRQVQKASSKGTDGLDLLERLRKWRPAENELRSGKEFEANWPPNMVVLLNEYDLKPASSGKYLMDSSTAPKWIGFIASVLDSLRQIFDDESKEPTAIPNVDEEPTKRMFLDKARVEAVDGLTRTLLSICRNRELQSLFTLDSLKEIRPGTADVAAEGGRIQSSAVCMDGEGVVNLDDDDLPILRGEYNPIHLRNASSLFLYLRALGAWRRSVYSLFGPPDRLDILSSLEVCCADLTACSTLTEVSSLVNSVMEISNKWEISTEECQASKTWIEEQLQRDTTPVQVHAEAGLTALIYDVYGGRVASHCSSKSYVRALKPFGSAYTCLPIGISKSCCGICCRLAELVQVKIPYNPRIDLPTSHGTIYPWDPPAHLPLDILMKLHWELVGKLAQHAVARGVKK